MHARLAQSFWGPKAKNINEAFFFLIIIIIFYLLKKLTFYQKALNGIQSGHVFLGL
jgi:hypothetical protein